MNTLNNVSITFRFDSNGDEETYLLIGPPTYEDEGEWRCPYQFIGFSNTKIRWISGIDAIQALELAIRVATGAFSQLEEVQAGKVTWLGTSNLTLSKNLST